MYCTWLTEAPGPVLAVALLSSDGLVVNQDLFAQSQLDDLIWAYSMNEATFGKIAEYSINDTLGISEVSTFDLRCNLLFMRPLYFSKFSVLVCSCAFSLVAISVRRQNNLILGVVVLVVEIDYNGCE
jgi:hypothetical protein